jgi:uncharacterized membrane protein YphA (DoxX/SURF4 family)
MNITLWIFQIVLAVVFAFSGLAKVSMSRERLVASGQTGVAVFPMPVVRFTATCELFAVLGLLLPWLTGILPALTPIAATGLCVVMVGAASSHARLHEPRNVAANALLFGLALTVAIGRFAGLA